MKQRDLWYLIRIEQNCQLEGKHKTVVLHSLCSTLHHVLISPAGVTSNNQKTKLKISSQTLMLTFLCVLTINNNIIKASSFCSHSVVLCKVFDAAADGRNCRYKTCFEKPNNTLWYNWWLLRFHSIFSSSSNTKSGPIDFILSALCSVCHLQYTMDHFQL